ncbi:MAG: ATP-binding protein [Pirellulales bacterium]|nr:ATP-binding protein [Pirellulales bacterium]
MFWWPAYRLGGLLKMVTAGVSVLTVVALIPVIPKALMLRSTQDLQNLVAERTHELYQVNQTLQSEIHAHRLSQAALELHEVQLRLALDAAQMGYWEWDLVEGYCTFDQRCRELWGFVDQPGKIDTNMIFDRVMVEFRDWVRQRTEAALEKNGRYQAEFQITHPTLGVRWLEGCGKVIWSETGQALKMIGLNWDITARRKFEENLRLSNRALEAATNGILVTDAKTPHCEILYANRGFELLTGYSRQEIVGRNCRFLQGPKTDPAMIRLITEALSRQTDVNVVLLNYRKDGTEFWNEVRISPLRDEQGNVTHYVGIQSDVTERKSIEDTLRLAQAQAQSANEAKSAFLANMSHEIRTPLTAVLGCADTLYPRLTDDEQREMVQMIRNQGQLLLGILNDVLDLSKIEAGKLEVNRVPCSLLQTIEDVHSLFAPLAQEKGIELHTDYPEFVPRLINTDPLRVRQILINLVGNAIKFTERGQVIIHVRPYDPLRPGFLRIDVSDTGVGIAREKLADIFTAFHQEHRHLSQKYGGTGLGLTICQRLTELLEGRIEVQSTLNRGTQVGLELPLTEEEAASTISVREQLAADNEHIHETLRVTIPLRVLVAEDTRSVQYLVRRMLEDVQARVTVVNTGQEAMDLMLKSAPGKEPFDVILMDMQMPVLNGFDATARLRSLGYKLPIIALTAAALQGDREKCLEAGCNDYLPKPLERHQLFLVLAKYADQILNY